MLGEYFTKYRRDGFPALPPLARIIASEKLQIAPK
jgi:hypothetical protein